MLDEINQQFAVDQERIATRNIKRRLALIDIESELLVARSKFPPMNSAHEGYAVLKEEVDEMWDAIKANDITHARKEAVQVAAMALSFILDMEGKN